MALIRNERDLLRRLNAGSRAQAKRKLHQATESGILISFHDGGVTLYHRGRPVQHGYPFRPTAFWSTVGEFEMEAQQFPREQRRQPDG